MVAPLIAVALRAAASQAVKQAAKSAAKKAAKSGAKNALSKKELNKAARRYANATKRFDKMMEAERTPKGGLTRYGQLLKKAKERTSYLERELRSTDLDSDSLGRAKELVEHSSRFLVRNSATKAARGNLLGEILLNGTMQGHRFFAVTRDLWDATSYATRYEQIQEAFGGKNLMEIIQEIEKHTGIKIMKGDINSIEKYGGFTREEMQQVELYIMQNYQ